MMNTTPRRTPSDFPVSYGIARTDAPQHVRAAVHATVAGCMAGHLTLHQIDISNRIEARNALEVAGFGEVSISTLLDRAIEIAKATAGDRA